MPQALAEGLGSGALPSLEFLNLFGNALGESGAAVLAAALGRGALPNLRYLGLGGNAIGNAGLIALAPPLRDRPLLQQLEFNKNDIGDEGVAALLAPGEEVLPSLRTLQLHNNHITNAGCEAIAEALSNGALPSLSPSPRYLLSAGNLIPPQGLETIESALDKRYAERGRVGWG